MGPRREIKLSGSNEYVCFETNNSRTWSREFHFHMAFLVVEILNQRQLIKYAYIFWQRAIFGGGPPNLKRIKYFNLSFCHNHLPTKPNIYAKFERNQWFELHNLLSGFLPGFLMDTRHSIAQLIACNFLETASHCVAVRTTVSKGALAVPIPRNEWTVDGLFTTFPLKTSQAIPVEQIIRTCLPALRTQFKHF